MCESLPVKRTAKNIKFSRPAANARCTGHGLICGESDGDGNEQEEIYEEAYLELSHGAGPVPDAAAHGGAGGGDGGDGADAPGRGGIDRPGKRGSEAGKPALPDAKALDGMDDADAMAVYEAFQTACDAYYETLTEGQQAQLKNTEKLEALSAWFSQLAALAAGGHQHPICGSTCEDGNHNE